MLHDHHKYPSEPLELTGTLELRTFYANTKRSFSGIYFVTELGNFLIRPAHLPASARNPMQALLGKKIRATGEIRNEVFLAAHWEEAGEA
jgi:hypothetical protein